MRLYNYKNQICALPWLAPIIRRGKYHAPPVASSSEPPFWLVSATEGASTIPVVSITFVVFDSVSGSSDAVVACMLEVTSVDETVSKLSSLAKPVVPGQTVAPESPDAPDAADGGLRNLGSASRVLTEA